jgi:hypothetical protein
VCFVDRGHPSPAERPQAGLICRGTLRAVVPDRGRVPLTPIGVLVPHLWLTRRVIGSEGYPSGIWPNVSNHRNPSSVEL